MFEFETEKNVIKKDTFWIQSFAIFVFKIKILPWQMEPGWVKREMGEES